MALGYHRHSVFPSLLIFFSVILFSLNTPIAYPSTLAKDETSGLELSPSLRVGTFDGGLPPFEEFTQGQLTGIGPDILKDIAGRLSLSINVEVYPTRLALMQALQQSDIDVAMNFAPTFMDAKYLTYSLPYAANDLVIVTTRENRQILDYTDLNSAKLITVAGSPEAIVLPEVYPMAHIIKVNSQAEALARLEKGTADAFIGNRYAVRYYTALNKTHVFRVVGDANLPLQTLRFAFPKDKTALADAFDKAITDIGNRKQHAIFEKWISAYPVLRSQSEHITLTLEQIKLLNQLPRLNVSNLEPYQPFSFRNQKGEPSGLVEDYFDLVQRQLQLKTERVRARTLNELIQLTRAGEIDIIPGLPPTEARRRSLAFSTPYASFPLVIITRKETSNIQGIESLGKARVAISESAEPIPTLLAKNKTLTLVHADTVEAGLDLLANKQVDAYIGNLVVSDRIISEKYSNVLKVAAPTGYEAELAIAVTKRYAYLIPLINQALANISPARKELIRNTWFPIRFNEDITWQMLIHEVLPALLVILVIMIIMMIAYWQLRKEIRQRVIAQKMLANQLAFQHALLETIPFPVLGKDRRNRYIAVNSAFEKLTGHLPANILGKTPQECGDLDALLALELEPDNQNTLQASKDINRSLRYTDTSGMPREGLFWLKHFYNKEGILGGSVSVLVDVTPIRLSENRALKSEALLTAITESLPVTVFQFCLAADGTMRFTYVAGAPMVTFGISAETMMVDHDSFYRRLNAEDRHIVHQAFLTMQKTLQPFQVEFRMQIKNDLCWIRANTGTGKREKNGDVIWGGYFEDITAARQQEKQLQIAKTEAEAAANTKATFLATMSHEIRTPIHGIQVWLELLERTSLTAEQNKMLTTVQGSARHLTQVIDDILDFSKLEAGQVALENIELDIRLLLSELLQTFSIQAEKKGLELNLYLDHRVAHQVQCDPVRLRQILTNLLSNSLKFTHSGHILLRVDLIEDGVQTQQLRFSVADSGIGISPDMQQKLFNPFQQAEASTTRRFGGSGLGLAISKGLAEQMGGQLTLHSAPGNGTTLNLDATFNVSATPPPLTDFSAVICCDQVPLADALKEMLKAMGLSVASMPSQTSIQKLLDQYDLLFISAEEIEWQSLSFAERRKVIGIIPQSTYSETAGKSEIGSHPLSWEQVKNICDSRLSQPREAATAREAPTAQAHPQANLDRQLALQQGRLILVAEDHPVSRELIRHQLQLLGYCFDLVEDGQQALAAIQTTAYGLAIVDCHMPNIDGLELSRQVREAESQHGGKRLTIVALTAGVLEGQAEECIAAGMDAYLRKPLDINGLKEMLAHYLAPSINASPKPTEPPGTTT